MPGEIRPGPPSAGARARPPEAQAPPPTSTVNTQSGRHDALWVSPPAELTLGRNEIHVWSARLDREPAELRTLSASLDREEGERAARYVFERHRARFAVARGVLRDILSRYLACRPAEIGFESNEYGKPSLSTGGPGGTPLHFNVSHSEGLALYAFSAETEVGVDVERIREDVATAEIAGQFFSPAEVRALGALPPHLKTEAFFNCWTRKEAYIKALGKGVSHPLDRFTVSLAPGHPALLLTDETDPAAHNCWSLRALPTEPGYAAALAARKRDWQLRFYGW